MQRLNENYEFVICSDLYDDKRTKSGKVIPKLVKKDIKTRLRVYLADIFLVEEVVGEKGKVEKEKCGIHVKDIGRLVVREPYNKVSTLVFGESKFNNAKQVGFVSSSK